MTAHVGAFYPTFDAVGIADAGASAPGIKQHDDERAMIDRDLHYQTFSGFIDKAGLAQADFPRGIPDQRIGIAKAHCAPAQNIH